jgi:hypothetical protein
VIVAVADADIPASCIVTPRSLAADGASRTGSVSRLAA